MAEYAMSVGHTHINIEGSRDQYCLSCEIHLSGQDYYIQTAILDDLFITVDGVTFEFFVESKQRNRRHGGVNYIVKGLSKTALLDAPYSEPLSGEYTGLASEIVASLAVGYTVNWDTVDWFIPANTLMPADQTPLQIIRAIASAVGAVIQTEHNGEMTIEPKYPVSVPGWATTAPDYTVSDAFDFFTTSEDYEHKPGYNRYLVGDELTSEDNLRIEEEALTRATKYIRVYEVPWVNGFYTEHTGSADIVIQDEGIENKLIEDEWVEIVAGSGSLSYPFYSLVSEVMKDTSLGSLTYSEDGTVTTDVAEQSLALVSYYTKCRKYLVTNYETEKLQIVVEED